MDDDHARRLIEARFAGPARNQSLDPGLAEALEYVLEGLEEGRLRVARPTSVGWVVETWIRQAILLIFRTHASHTLELGPWVWHDKIDLQIEPEGTRRLASRGVRLVPPAIVRRGAYIGPRTVLMPSYVNIGAYVGAETMIDTWATIGSCAQIGDRVHVSGGAGIGGVLEPVRSRPVIIEDDCFIGARSEIVDGVHVRRGAVIAMGVFLGASTKIYDRARGTVTYGEIPEYAVVVPGSLPSEGGCALACAVIVKRVDAETRAKLGINEILRA